jgi:hypothetical protein
MQSTSASVRESASLMRNAAPYSNMMSMRQVVGCSLYRGLSQQTLASSNRCSSSCEKM